MLIIHHKSAVYRTVAHDILKKKKKKARLILDHQRNDIGRAPQKDQINHPKVCVCRSKAECASHVLHHKKKRKKKEKDHHIPKPDNEICEQSSPSAFKNKLTFPNFVFLSCSVVNHPRLTANKSSKIFSRRSVTST